MFIHDIEIRVRYAETDQMGYVYYGNYATYFEVARVETMRALGFSYKELEESGILMPVLDLKIKYIRPCKYDDLLCIKTIIRQKPTARILFEYEIYNQENTLTTKAETTLVFIGKESQRPVPAPEGLQSLLAEKIESI